MKTSSQDKKTLAKKIQRLFLLKGIAVLPIKLYAHDNDIDLVIIAKNKYNQAMKILEKNGWAKNNNLSKLRERDKDFFSHQKTPFLIHLHQAFSWNTIPYLDSQTLWQRKIKKEDLWLPSPEDELLIIAAHSLFENKQIVTEEVKYGQQLLKEKLNLSYCQKHAQKFNWAKGWQLFLKKLNRNQTVFGIRELLRATLNKLGKDLSALKLSLVSKGIINYFLIDWIWSYRNMLKKRRKKRIIISFSGIDGSGKSSQAQMIYQYLSQKGLQVKIAHLGGGPKISSSLPNDSTLKKFLNSATFFKDALQVVTSLILYSLEDYLIFDRFIYDTLVKIGYRQKKKKLPSILTQIAQHWPQPDLAFLLEAKPQTSYQRDQDHSLQYHHQKAILYKQLKNHFSFCLINGELPRKKVSQIVKKEVVRLIDKP